MVFKNVELNRMLSQSIDSILPDEEHSIDSNVDSQSTSAEIKAPALIGYDQSGRKIAVDVSKLATGEQKLSERWGVSGDQFEEKRYDDKKMIAELIAPFLMNTALFNVVKIDSSVLNVAILGGVTTVFNYLGYSSFTNSHRNRNVLYEFHKIIGKFSKSELAIIEDSSLQHSISSFVPKRDVHCIGVRIDTPTLIIPKGEQVMCVNPTPLDSSSPDSKDTAQDLADRERLNLELLSESLSLTRKLMENNSAKHVLILRHPSNAIAADKNVETFEKMVSPFSNGPWATYLSRDEFFSLTETPLSLTEKLFAELDDPILSEYFDLLKNAKTHDEQQKIKELISVNLFNKLQAQIRSIAGTPELHRVSPVQKARSYSDVSIRKNQATGVENEYFFLRTNPSEGLTVKPVSTVLRQKGIDINDVESIIANQGSPYQKAQILYALLRDLDSFVSSGKNTNNKLINNKSRQDLIDEINERKWKLDPMKFSDFENGLRYKPYTAIEQAKRTILASALSLGIAFGISTATSSNEKIDTPKPVQAASEINTFSRPEFGAIQSDDPLWQINAKGLDPSGYYVTGTSHEFADGGWINDLNIESAAEDFPTTINEDEPHLEINKLIPNSVGTIAFKIPTQVGTQLKALSLVDHLGKPLPKSAFKLLFFGDGTVGLNIDGNESRSAYFFELKALFAKSESADLVPHANGSLKPIQIETLPKDLQQKLIPSIGIDPESLSKGISTNKVYSEDASEEIKNKLAKAVTPEEMLNVTNNIDSCECQVCNTNFVLTDAVVSSGDSRPSDLNYAEGFRNDAGGYLSTREGHAFALNSDGKVFDATAVRIPESNNAVATISPNDGISMDDKYSQQLAELKKSAIDEGKSRESEQSKANKIYLGLLGAGIAAASLYDYTKTINLLKD